MHRDFSPEEKLLNLIKRKAAPKRGHERKDESPPGHKAGAYAAPEGLGGGTSAPDFGLSQLLKLEHIKVLNTVLFIIFIILILFFLADIFFIPPADMRGPAEEGPAGKISRAPGEPGYRPFSYYSKDLGKNIFAASLVSRDKEPEKEVPLEVLMNELALLGIVSGENPQAIIENRVQKRSFFLTAGQTAGGVLLKEIKKERVTVIYKGREIVLTL